MSWVYNSRDKVWVFQKGGVSRLTREETKRNRKRNKERQRILAGAGYNVQEGKPWGPWQQKQWESYISKQPVQNTHGQAQDIFTRELDQWIKANPVSYGMNTKDFRNFLISIARTESSFDPRARHGSHYGYFQIKNLREGKDQFEAAFKHLSTLFSQSITKQDLLRARQLGITQGELLSKYWNQQNRVTNYLHRGVDASDGEGTPISTYHNNDKSVVDMSKYVPKAITSDYVILDKGQSVGSIAPRVRNSNIDYSDKEGSIHNMNAGRVLGKGRTYPTVWPGDTLYINKPTQ